MSNLTAAQRKKLPLEDFGDEKRRLFPILDQSDVDSAAHLIGKASNPDAVKARIIAICKRKGFTVPNAWQEKKATMSTLAVALGGASVTDEPGMVRRTGLITKPGEYPANNWSITPEELKASAERFTGTGYVEVEHFTTIAAGKPSILDGQTGYLEGVWSSDDGEELWGDLILPEWLNTIADTHGGKLSGVFDPETKNLVGVGLVMEPAVPEAAMLSAYVTFAARHDTQQGQYAMQRIHDSAVSGGATCTAGNVTMASKHEASAIQQAHDLAVQHGAKCEAVGTRTSMMFSKSEQQEVTTVADNKTQEPTIADLQQQLDAEKAQREADRRALVTLQAERRVEKADLWVDKLITDNRVLPAERDLLVRLHVMASTDDDTSGLVTLSDGGKESRLATLAAALQARQPLGLTKEVIDANPAVAILLNRQKTIELEEANKDTPEEKDKLLEMTPLGKQALAARRRRASGQ